MAQQPIRFNDGAAYERGMSPWSQLAGQVFLDWLAPQTGLRWIDIGCGNGAFTELLVQRCQPAEIQGIDPSDAQLAFARTRPGARGAVFQQGDAMALPFDADRFDAAVMALVLFFVPDPAKGVAEMARVICPGGTISAYVWDTFNGGSPSAPFHAELQALGVTTTQPPSAEVSRIAALREQWTGAGLEAVETREIAVQRVFTDFEALWLSGLAIPAIGPMVASLAPGDAAQMKARLRARVASDTSGRVMYTSRANAIQGLVPKSP